MRSDAPSAPDTSALRYVGASSIEVPVGDLSGFDVEATDGQTIGRLDGVVIDPLERRVHFFVVAPATTRDRRRYLLPTECQVQLDRERSALRVGADSRELARCVEFRTACVPPFSDQDLLAAMFQGRKA